MDNYSIISNGKSRDDDTPQLLTKTICSPLGRAWTKEVPSPTWGKLDDVIKSLTIPMHMLTSYKDSDHLKTYYKATRFTIGEETWPPEQPKHFTPVVLIYQEGRWSKKETEVMAAATSKGGIEEYLSTTTSKTVSLN